jgi:ubiquinone/menaquinone biosynthesis C-methylase UbiE
LARRLTEESAQARAERTYNSAAGFFDLPALGFWNRFGQATVDHLSLGNGASVLDVCCGAGASALPAARMVGPVGHVLAVDLADNLLELGRAKARVEALDNIDFRHADMLALGLDSGSFDAVVCVFGIFFVPDIPAAIRELWRLVKPNGQLAITTWGPRIFEPAVSYFWDAVGELRPELVQGYQPWDRITDVETLREVLRSGGVDSADIQADDGVQQLSAPEDWWSIVLGTGYRNTVDQLGPEWASVVRDHCIRRLRVEHVRQVETNVIYARSEKRTSRV